MSFEPAGSDDDLRRERMRKVAQEAWTNAERLIAEAREILAAGGELDTAEKHARDSLAAYASALNWAEGSDLEDEAHRRMDEAGKWVRRTFGCSLHHDGESYSQRCPVALGHVRVGMSIGGVARHFCSLCGEDLSECEHKRGMAYWVPGGTSDLGWCRVCGSAQCDDHLPSSMYRASVGARIRDVVLQEVSLVGRPAHPDARFTSMGVSIADLRASLGEAFVPGMKVNCDRCLLACDGLVQFDGVHG